MPRWRKGPKRKILEEKMEEMKELYEVSGFLEGSDDSACGSDRDDARPFARTTRGNAKIEYGEKYEEL
jgi:hypothetical protein